MSKVQRRAKLCISWGRVCIGFASLCPITLPKVYFTYSKWCNFCKCASEIFNNLQTGSCNLEIYHGMLEKNNFNLVCAYSTTIWLLVNMLSKSLSESISCQKASLKQLQSGAETENKNAALKWSSEDGNDSFILSVKDRLNSMLVKT